MSAQPQPRPFRVVAHAPTGQPLDPQPQQVLDLDRAWHADHLEALRDLLGAPLDIRFYGPWAFDDQRDQILVWIVGRAEVSGVHGVALVGPREAASEAFTCGLMSLWTLIPEASGPAVEGIEADVELMKRLQALVDDEPTLSTPAWDDAEVVADITIGAATLRVYDERSHQLAVALAQVGRTLIDGGAS